MNPIEGKTFTFNTDRVGFETIGTKAEKKHYITGYISTPNIDLVDDLATMICLKDVVAQLNNGNIKLDVEHEAFKGNANKLPIGKIVEAILDKTGIWIKALINSDSPDFKSVWGSIKNGFLDAFSITFKTIDTVRKNIKGKSVRLLNKINLLNVALTGNPINQDCRIQTIFMKSIDFEQKNKTGDNMTETKTAEDFAAEKKALEEKITAAEKKAEESATATAEATKKLADNETATADAAKAAADKTAAEAAGAEKKAKEAVEAEKKALQDKLDEQATQLKAIQEKLQMPVFKSAIPAAGAAGAEVKSDVIIGPLSFIK